MKKNGKKTAISFPSSGRNTLPSVEWVVGFLLAWLVLLNQ